MENQAHSLERSGKRVYGEEPQNSKPACPNRKEK